jgi:hypothetical protein
MIEQKIVSTSFDNFQSFQSISTLDEKGILKEGLLIRGIDYDDCDKIIKYMEDNHNKSYAYTAFGDVYTMAILSGD